jgi:hypothetical protein
MVACAVETNGNRDAPNAHGSDAGGNRDEPRQKGTGWWKASQKDWRAAMAKEVEEKESKKTREREGGKKNGEGEREEGRKAKAPKKHLHRLTFEVLRDHEGKPTGKFTEHHTYKSHPADHLSEPERPVNAHNSPEEAGESAQEVLGQAAGGGQEPDEEAQAQPAQAGGGAEPEPGM